MTVIEKLKQIEPVVRSCTNGYNADILLEAIKRIEELESPQEPIPWSPGGDAVTTVGGVTSLEASGILRTPDPELTVISSELDDDYIPVDQPEELESE